MANIDRKLRVFLCHASQDKPVVRELYQRLLAEGWIDPWLDEEKLLPGQEWDMEIEKAVESADVVIVFLSNNSVTKEGYIQRELRFALSVADYKPEGTIFLIPIRLDDCQMPRKLKTWQYIDYFPSKNKRTVYKKLFQSLRLRASAAGINGIPKITEASASHSKKPKPYSPPKKSQKTNLGQKYGDVRPIQSKGSDDIAEIGVETNIFGGIEFVKVLAGTFMMGSATIPNATPLHEVNIPYDYWISRFPVSSRQYALKKEVDSSGPFAMVEWSEALSYIKWLNKSYKNKLPSGYKFTMVSEAEWEKAARGFDGRNYPWGNTLYEERCYIGGRTYPALGSYSPLGDSPYGVSDLIKEGFWEWTCTTAYDKQGEVKYPYSLFDGREYGRQADFWGTDYGTMIVRGGCALDPKNKSNKNFTAVAARKYGNKYFNYGGKWHDSTLPDKWLIRLVTSFRMK